MVPFKASLPKILLFTNLSQLNVLGDMCSDPLLTHRCPPSLSVGDVCWPGDEGCSEAASPPVAPSGQAGVACRCGIWTALHPRYGCHCHLLHPPAQRHLQVSGEYH